MPVTQKEVAIKMGVSQMTVSYALRDSQAVSPELRRQVQDVALKMGYRPNGSAVAVRTGRFGCVAVVEPTSPGRASFFGGTLLNGMHDALLENGMHLVLARLPDEKLTDDRFVPKILGQFVADGLLINYFARIPPRMVELIQSASLPAIWINSRQAQDCVYLDDHAAAREATRRLITLGHRRIIYVDYLHEKIEAQSLQHTPHHSITDRYRGYIDQMKASGLQQVGGFGSTPVPSEDHVNLALALLRNGDRPTAVLCYSRPLAVEMLFAAARLGLHCPRDLSLMMFDDQTVSEIGVKVSGMRHHWYRVGQVASQALIEKINNGGESRLPPRVLRFEFEEGQTLGPPPRTALG